MERVSEKQWKLVAKAFRFSDFRPTTSLSVSEHGGKAGVVRLVLPYYSVNLSDKTIAQIGPPHKVPDYSGLKEEPGQQITPVIESYEWSNDNSLKVIFYFVGYFNDSKYYRISPKEIWRYDLNTKQYTFLQTLPENATSFTP